MPRRLCGIKSASSEGFIALKLDRCQIPHEREDSMKIPSDDLKTLGQALSGARRPGHPRCRGRARKRGRIA